MPPALTQMLAWWSSYYGDHQALSVTIRYVHLAAMLLGGGSALTIDRRVARLWRLSPGDRAAALALLNGSHAAVVAALAVVVATGVLMVGADIDTYVVSPLFWTKMGLFALLILNGTVLAIAGRRADPPRRLTTAAIASAVLWLVIVYVSTWLVVAA
jgi:uncharacterized membrane protein